MRLVFIKNIVLIGCFSLIFSSSMLTGVVATVASAPFDLVKTRMMVNQKSVLSTVKYKNSLHCLFKVLIIWNFYLWKG